MVWAVRQSIARHLDRMLRPGDAVAGRNIVVFTEQGLGDNIMFARYLPLLTVRGARVTLACSPTLRPIFEHVDGIHALLSPPPEHPAGKLNLSALHFDAFAPLLSLPYVLGTTQETIPADIPYLRADPLRVAAWRERYSTQGRTDRRRIGVVFQANPEGRSALRKSMRISDLAPLGGDRRRRPREPATRTGGTCVRGGRSCRHRCDRRADATRRGRRGDRSDRPADQRRYHGCALRRCDGVPGLGGAAGGAGLALGARASGVPLVSVRQSVPPDTRRWLGGCDRRAMPADARHVESKLSWPV